MSQQRTSISSVFSTTDLALASALSLYFPLESIDRTNPHKAQFVFMRADGIDQLIEAYWKNELQVNPAAYFNQIRAVKARLYGERSEW